jgi:hypothetical protein
VGHSFGVRFGHPGGREDLPMMGTSRYEIRIRGRLGETVAKRFEGFDMEVEPVETVLRGPVLDQAALHGILGQIESLGLELVEVRRVDGSRSES